MRRCEAHSGQRHFILRENRTRLPLFSRYRAICARPKPIQPGRRVSCIVEDCTNCLGVAVDALDNASLMPLYAGLGSPPRRRVARKSHLRVGLSRAVGACRLRGPRANPGRVGTPGGLQVLALKPRHRPPGGLGRQLEAFDNRLLQGHVFAQGGRVRQHRHRKLGQRRGSLSEAAERMRLVPHSNVHVADSSFADKNGCPLRTLNRTVQNGAKGSANHNFVNFV